MSSKILQFTILLWSLTFVNFQAIATTNIEALVDSAVMLMDKHLYADSQNLLEEIVNQNPKHYEANYELGYLKCLLGKYDESLSHLKTIENSSAINDRYYQLLGSIYDFKGLSDDAISSYQRGLSKFPDSGRLHVELGMMYHKSNDIYKALETYEKGILADPMFPSNYFYAGLVLMDSSEPVWGLMYGEIFMNLEPYTTRSKTMSEYIVSTIKNNVVLNDSTCSASFTKQSVGFNPENMKFEIGFPLAYQMCFNAAGRGALEEGMDEISLYSLGFLHGQQIAHGTAYYDMANNNPLFEYLLKIIDAGYIEEYCALLYKGGFPQEYGEWMIMNKDRYLDFMEWRENHSLKFNPDNVFSRLTCPPINIVK